MNKITVYNVKKLLKIIKLNESAISMILGIIVIIIVGSIVIKYLKTDKGSVPLETLSQNNSLELQSKVHKVQKDESLWNISVQYYGDGFKWVDIATENKLSNASVIEVGQDLIIPNTELEKVVVSDESDTTDSIASDLYTVQKGDSLWEIAVRAYGDGYQWVKIASENKLSHPNLIHTGNVIVIPR